LTAVAGTAVLGTRLVQQRWIGASCALLGVALLLWVVLLPAVLRHWRAPTRGENFLACVATEGIAVLSAALAGILRIGWLAICSGVAFAGGLGLYLFALRDFDFGQLLTGDGDQWIFGGAISISSLAGAQIIHSVAHLRPLSGAGPPIHAVDVVLLALALILYGVLCGCEALAPRAGTLLRRWATVFPLGMTAAATRLVAQVEHAPRLATLGALLTWVATLAWLTVAGCALATLRRSWHGFRSLTW
jgi:hypothetical protein